MNAGETIAREVCGALKRSAVCPSEGVLLFGDLRTEAHLYANVECEPSPFWPHSFPGASCEPKCFGSNQCPGTWYIRNHHVQEVCIAW